MWLLQIHSPEPFGEHCYEKLEPTTTLTDFVGQDGCSRGTWETTQAYERTICLIRHSSYHILSRIIVLDRILCIYMCFIYA